MVMMDEETIMPGLWNWPPRWEEESHLSVRDLVLVPVFTLMFPIVRFLLDRFLFERMGRKSIAGFSDKFSKLSETEREDSEKRLIKYKESAWKCVYFATAELLALAVTYNEPWFMDTKWFYIGPGDQIWPHLSAKLKLKMFYSFCGGFYIYSIFALCFWETRRKDFGISMTHHLGTAVLIILSYVVNLHRAGSVILALHDASDVFLEIGKLTKYSGLNLVPEISFGLFALSWVLLRLLYFPCVIIKSTTYGVLQALDKEKHKHGPYLYYILNSLLICLLVLHIYWWVLIWRMIKKQIQDSGKVSEDVRSDSDDDSDDDSDSHDVKKKKLRDGLRALMFVILGPSERFLTLAICSEPSNLYFKRSRADFSCLPFQIFLVFTRTVCGLVFKLMLMHFFHSSLRI